MVGRGRGMPELDQGFKWLLQEHAPEMLALALPGAEFLAPMPTEFAAAPQLVLDTLLRVRYQGVECAVDFEAEVKPRPGMPRRLFEYGTRANIATGLPVLSVVLWFESGGAVPRSPYELRAGKHLIATWHFTGIKLFDMHTEALFARGDAVLLALAPFTREGNHEDVIERAAHIIEGTLPPEKARDLDLWLILFGSRRLGRATMLDLLRRLPVTNELITGSPMYQMWVSEAEARGKAEGEARGEEIATRNAARVMLEGRFGTLPPALAGAISTASVDALLGVLAHGAVEPLEALAARLGVTLEG